MAGLARYLITTADEETWKFDQPVIFLGEWCRHFERRKIWEEMNSIVAAPYGLGASKIDADIQETNFLERELFTDFCKTVNEYHKTQHTERFWKIILGHWFHEYISTIYNRYHTLEKCLKEYNISGVSGYCTRSFSLAVQKFDPCWYEALDSSKWNSLLYTRIFEILEKNDVKIEILDLHQGFGSWCSHPDKVSKEQASLRQYISLLIKKSASKLKRNSDAFIMNTYLPKLDEIRLQFTFLQFPQFWDAPTESLEIKVDSTARMSLTQKFLDGSEDDLLRVLKTLIFEVIPVRYLEGFSMIRELASKEQWPQKPKFIFTSNAFYSSDILKYWLASKVESGTKYFVGQHGNSYFTDRRQRYCIEETTADHFLTWGWTDGTNKYIPTFVFQGKIVCKSKDNQSGGLLLINSGPAPSRTTYDVSSLSEEYFQMNKKFLENLNHAPRNGTILRLYAGSSRHAFSEKNRWRDFDPNLTVDDGFTQINALINESRLVVHSYDSTGMLLSLSQNIPTLAYWINGFDHLSSEVVEDYNLLLEAGIIHLSGESAAQKVNEIWESIDEWWQQKDLQHARKVFCQKYARVSSQKVRGLRKALKS